MKMQANHAAMFQRLEDYINRHAKHEKFFDEIMHNLRALKSKKINIMITGATGCGKSSTINALFNLDTEESQEIAKVGVGVDPETMSIKKYEIGNMTLWDSPGLGDGQEADQRHSKNIIAKLRERDEDGNYLIDLVLVILDGSTRDLGTSYELINKVIIPNLGEEKSKRILVAINQADVAMKGRYWDFEENCPQPPLVQFLNEKCESVHRRILEGTGVDTTPIYYSAGFKEEGMPQGRPYNLAKLLYYILESVPAEKRLAIAAQINTEPEVWQDNDETNYPEKIKGSVRDGIKTGMMGMGFGAALGGTVAGPLGAIIGGTLGAIGGFLGGLFGW